MTYVSLLYFCVMREGRRGGGEGWRGGCGDDVGG